MQKLIRADSWLPLPPRRTWCLQPVFLFNCLSVICTRGRGGAQLEPEGWEWSTVNGQPPSSLALLLPQTSALPKPICFLRTLEATMQATISPDLPYTLVSSTGEGGSKYSSSICWSPVQGISWKGRLPFCLFNKDSVSPYNPSRRKICSFCHLEPRTLYVKQAVSFPLYRTDSLTQDCRNSLVSVPQIPAFRPSWLFRAS